MDKGTATILVKNAEALRVAASSGRISTQKGTALAIFHESLGDARDMRLVGKVLSSGHKSVIEHQTFSLAFDNVSVLVEQFMIEFRLASFTVKSRRYVDFSDAGFVVPHGIPDDAMQLYTARAQALFDLYSALLGLGVPKEDARFVLPYCFRSNFYVTANARELAHIIESMLYGHGLAYPEIVRLGEMLKAQFNAIYPDVIPDVAPKGYACAAGGLPDTFARGQSVCASARLLNAPRDAFSILNLALAFSGRTMPVCKLVMDARPRELEMLHYLFMVKNASLACMTHFARHRMQSPVFMRPLDAIARGNYVLPESVAQNARAKALYEGAFAAQAAFAETMRANGLSDPDCAYLAMSGHTGDILFSMNARELLHFMKLRTCARAQWEIREIACEMLTLLRESAPEIFNEFGASCYVTGVCPEGRLTCGKPQKKPVCAYE